MLILEHMAIYNLDELVYLALSKCSILNVGLHLNVVFFFLKPDISLAY